MKFIVAGVQRTGTNFCTQILKETNKEFHDVVESGDRYFFWKHSKPFESGPNYSKGFITPLSAVINTVDLHVVLVSKHPLWWFSSIVNRDSADLRKQRPAIFKEDGNLNVMFSLKFYLSFYREWLCSLDSRKIIHIPYHSVMNESSNLLSAVNSSFATNFAGDVDLNKMKVPYSKGNFEEKSKIYSSSDYGLPGNVIEEYESCLTYNDKTFLTSLGY